MNGRKTDTETLFSSETIRQLVSIILRRWYIFILVLLISSVGSFLILSISPPSYEAVSVVVLAPPPLKEKQDALSELMPKNLKVQDYQIMLRSEPVLYKVRESLKKSDLFEKLPPFEDMKEGMNPQIRVIKKTSSQLEYSSVILLRARSNTGEKAAFVANTWADVAIETSKNHYEHGLSGMKGFLSSEIANVTSDYESKIQNSADQIETILQKLNESKKKKIVELNKFRDEKENKIKELKKKLNLEYMEEELKNLAEILKEQKVQMAEIKVKIQGEQERVETLKKDLEKTPRKIVLNKGLTDTALAMISSGKGEIQEDLKDKTIIGEETNEVYLVVSELLANAGSELASLKKQEQTLEAKISESEEEYKKIFSEIQDARYQLSEMERELAGKEEILQEELDEKVQTMEMQKKWRSEKIDEELSGQKIMLKSLITKYLSSQMAEAVVSPDLKIFSRAQAPTQYLPRRRAAKSLSIAVLALIFTFLLVLVIEVFRSESTKIQSNF